MLFISASSVNCNCEVRYSEKEKKVIYEPVKLEQDYRNFDFESPWEGTEYSKQLNNLEKDGKKN